MNSYELSRNFCEWAFNNPERVKPIHYAIYFFALEHCNRLGWKDKFGFPSQMVMEAIGVKNWKTYSSGLNELVDFGFIRMIEISKNQYSSNIIAIVKNTKALTKALDKALSTHNTKQSTKQCQSTPQSTVSIDKQITINKEQGTNIDVVPTLCVFNFKNSMLQFGFFPELVDEWLIVRKQKKAVNSETSFKMFINEVLKITNIDKNEILRLCVGNSWKGFKAEWLNNLNNNQNGNSTNNINGNFATAADSKISEYTANVLASVGRKIDSEEPGASHEDSTFDFAEFKEV